MVSLTACVNDPVRPNILLIIADDLSFDHYSYAGHPTIQTPNIDDLAADSEHFDNGYVPSSCRPTLATLLTGLPQRRHERTYTQSPALPTFQTIPHRLQRAGYSTYQAGKFWEGEPGGRGFDQWSTFTTVVGDMDIGREGIEPIIDFVETTTSPWFVWFSPRMPHVPHTPPPEWLELYDAEALNFNVQKYWARISWFDDVVGQLISRVPRDTVIIYLSDNGYIQADEAKQFRSRSKTSAYEHGIRTPILFSHPAWRPRRQTEPVHAVDIAATIVSIAGGSITDLPGIDVLHEEAPVAAIGSTWEPVTDLELWTRWVRSGDWKLIDNESGEDELYLLPDEESNLIGGPEEAMLREMLERLWDV